MECAFLVLQLCLFDPSLVSLEGDISWKTSGNRTFTVHGEPYTGSHGRLGIFVNSPIDERFTLRYGYEHRSYAETGRDDGAEYLVFGVVWKPFAR